MSPPPDVRVPPDQPSSPDWDDDTPSPGRSARIGWGLAFVLIGVVWALSWTGVPIDWPLVGALALIVIGVLVLVFGRRDLADGIVGVGVVVGLFTVFGGGLTTDGPWSAAIGERRVTPTTAEQLTDGAALGIGQLVFDLRSLDLEPGSNVTATARLGLGEIVVHVPDDIAVTGRARAMIGSTNGFQATGGTGVAADGDEVATVELDVHVGIGSIEVVQR